MNLHLIEKETSKRIISKLTDDGISTSEEILAREMPLTIIVNNQELVTLLCSPTDLNYLAVGFLFSEGFIKDKTDIKSVFVDDKRGIVRVETITIIEPDPDVVFKRIITSGCGRGASFYSAVDLQNQAKVESDMKILPQNILLLANEFQNHSEIYKATRCVHSAALCDTKQILVFKEDIGRHNAVDKILGECVFKDITTEGKLIVTSGRVTSEILLKVAHRNIPFLISRSVPTDLGVTLATELGITLIGFVRGRRLNIYSHAWRVEGSDESQCHDN